jgi:hypothetical protein
MLKCIVIFEKLIISTTLDIFHDYFLNIRTLGLKMMVDKTISVCFNFVNIKCSITMTTIKNNFFFFFFHFLFYFLLCYLSSSFVFNLNACISQNNKFCFFFHSNEKTKQKQNESCAVKHIYIYICIYVFNTV